MAPTLALTDQEFRFALLHRFGVSCAPPNAPPGGISCACGRLVALGDVDHAQTCPANRKAVTMRHEIEKSLWRRIISRGTVATALEPAVQNVAGGAAARCAANPRARGDILIAFTDGVAIADVSIVHPAGASYVKGAARQPGKAAAQRDAEKIAKYASADPNGYTFIPLSMESFGRLGKPAMQLLNRLATTAADSGAVRKDTFVGGALRELSVGLAKGNACLFRHFLHNLARNNGAAFVPGADVPYDVLD